MMQSEVRKQGSRVNLEEQAGISLKRLLQRSDPLRQSSCSRDDCFVCKERLMEEKVRAQPIASLTRSSVRSVVMYTLEKPLETLTREEKNTGDFWRENRKDLHHGGISRKNTAGKSRISA